MRILSRLGGLSLCVALSLSVSAAYAGDDDYDSEYGNPYPVQYTQRPLTLAEHGLEFYGTMDVTRLVKDTSNIVRELQTNLGIDAGAGFGITRNLEVHAVLATVRSSPRPATATRSWPPRTGS